MITEQIDRHAPWATDSEKNPVITQEKQAHPERTEPRVERQPHIARYGFELVSVTMRTHTSIETIAAEVSEQGRMLSSLVSTLNPEQKVTLLYEGGGRAPLRWQIIGEASSSESAKEAEEQLQNVRHAMMTVLESQKTCYRFRPISKRAAGQSRAFRSKWVGLIQPQGTHVRYARGRIGFTETAAETDSTVCLPLYTHERAGAFSSIAKLLVSSHVPMRVSIGLESCRLNRAQEQAIRSALEVILDRSRDSDLSAHLEDAANIWLKTMAGCRMTCSVSSSRPISESFLKMLAAEIYHGDVDVCSRRADDSSSDGALLTAALPSHVLDLRNCIPSTAALPPLFPQPEALARHGMRRFFNRERLALPKAGARMGSIQDGDTEQTVRLCDKERSRHLYILGATGTGKSTLLYNLTMQDIERGEGVCLIDPHGDLYKQVLDAIPPSRADDVVILDPCDRERAVGINLLDCTGPYREMQINFAINEVLAMMWTMYDMKICGGPMFEQYFRGALQLILADPDNPGTLIDMSAVFEHKGYRDAMLKKCGPSLLTDFWKMADNAQGEPRLGNLAPYIVSKLNMFVHNAVVRPIISQAKSTIDFRDIMDNRRILLVNLSRGALGELDMRLLGMVVLTKLMCAAMTRLSVVPSRRKPFMVYVDEFQNFTTGATASLLSESRKFGICLTLANQNLMQLSASAGQENLVDSVLGNVGSTVFFRLGAPDAEKLAIYTRPNFGPADLQNLPNYHALARVLTPTGPTDPFVFQTYPAARKRVNPTVRKRVQEAHRLYSTDIKTVEADIRKRREEIRDMGTGGGEKKAVLPWGVTKVS